MYKEHPRGELVNALRKPTWRTGTWESNPNTFDLKNFLKRFIDKIVVNLLQISSQITTRNNFPTTSFQVVCRGTILKKNY